MISTILFLKFKRKIRKSGLFDETFYLQANADVRKSGIDPIKHYFKFGGFEGRKPNPDFDSRYYLEMYEDVSESGMNPLLHYLLYGKKEGRRIHKIEEDTIPLIKESYIDWIKEFDACSEDEHNILRQEIEGFKNTPLISVIMPVYNPKPEWLRAAIESVIHQIYSNWELCIADDCSTDPDIRQILSSYEQKDSRIKVVFRPFNGHISEASNSALNLASGDYIALLDHDDLLPAHAFFYIVQTINRKSEIKLIYSDEDKIDDAGIRSEPYFKCDWNPELFYSQNLINHLGVYATEIVKRIGGFRVGYEGSQDYDLALRFIEHIGKEEIFHIPKVLYHWRIHDSSTSSIQNIKKYAFVSGQKALTEHFLRTGINATAQIISPGRYRIRYQLPEKLPLVTLIIPTKNKFGLLSNCINSILSNTSYPNYEILVIDNNSDEEETLNYLNKIQSDAKISCIKDERPFNFSALCNNAVHMAAGEFIGLINNDTEVINPEWLAEMIAIAAQPDIGAVGAKLFYPDNRIQHAGIILGIGGVAGHAHKHKPGDDCGYFGRAVLTQEMSAVTAACLIIRKSIYLEIGGMDEINLTISFNDVDFCLRLKQAGYRNIWTPYSMLYHHESISRGMEDTTTKRQRFQGEIDFMMTRWGKILLCDPSYNQNLTLKMENFGLAWPPRYDD